MPRVASSRQNQKWPSNSLALVPCKGCETNHKHILPKKFYSAVGATTPLFISGAAILVGAGATGVGGAAADIIISKNKCNAAQTIINRDVELTTELQLLEQVLPVHTSNVSLNLSTIERLPILPTDFCGIK